LRVRRIHGSAENTSIFIFLTGGRLPIFRHLTANRLPKEILGTWCEPRGDGAYAFAVDGPVVRRSAGDYAEENDGDE